MSPGQERQDKDSEQGEEMKCNVFIYPFFFFTVRKVQIYHHVISTALMHPHMRVCGCMCVVESMARRDIVLSEKTIILGSDMALITTKSSQCVVLEKRIREIYIL